MEFNFSIYLSLVEKQMEIHMLFFHTWLFSISYFDNYVEISDSYRVNYKVLVLPILIPKCPRLCENSMIKLQQEPLCIQ